MHSLRILFILLLVPAAASLGTEPHHTGLIKSLKADGSFESTVYTVPFHAPVSIEALRTEKQLKLSSKPVFLCQTETIRQGALIEISFTVNEAKPDNSMQIDFLHNGINLADKSTRISDVKAGQSVRVVYKLPIILDQVDLQISSTNDILIKDLSVVHHQDQSINLTRGIMEGKRHQGESHVRCVAFVLSKPKRASIGIKRDNNGSALPSGRKNGRI